MTSIKEEHPPPEMDPDGNARKRVCKACDRCRLKKSKCDGSSPCNRCQSDNAICVFGERKKAHDKVYPKGYVEMLEQDREKLVNATREMYNLLEANEKWPGPPLPKTGKGFPLVHDILDRLGLLNLPTGEYEEVFEESTEALRKQMRCTQISAEEENPYPTPATVQSAFSPAESDLTEPYPSQFLESDITLPIGPYHFAQPATTPNEQTPCMHDSGNMGVPSQLEDTASFSWYQHPSYAAMNTPSYNIATPPYGLGLVYERSSPCSPAYDNELGFPTFSEVST